MRAELKGILSYRDLFKGIRANKLLVVTAALRRAQLVTHHSYLNVREKAS